MKTEKNNSMHRKALMALLAVAVCLPLSVANAEPLPTFQTAEVHTFPGEPMETTSGGTLLRNKNEVTARLAMHGLAADSLYSVWWIIFNHPEECAGGIGGCGPGDFEASNGSVMNAAGFVTSSSGSANITADLEARRPAANQVLFGKGLLTGNGYRAEIHMIFQNHGLAADHEGNIGPEISMPTGADELGIGFLPVD